MIIFLGDSNEELSSENAGPSNIGQNEADPHSEDSEPVDEASEENETDDDSEEELDVDDNDGDEDEDEDEGHEDEDLPELQFQPDTLADYLKVCGSFLYCRNVMHSYVKIILRLW